MKVFTVNGSKVTEGAQPFMTKIGSMDVPMITVGETGRGRKEAMIPVMGMSDPSARIMDVRIEQKGDRHVFHALSTPSPENDECLVILKTAIGFRGGNDHTGDRLHAGADGYYQFQKFPGTILASGTIAQGDAGGMGSGNQYIAVIKQGDVFRIALSGRMYGNAATHYYLFDGEKIHVMTPNEREIAEAIGISPFPPFVVPTEVKPFPALSRAVIVRGNDVLPLAVAPEAENPAFAQGGVLYNNLIIDFRACNNTHVDVYQVNSKSLLLYESDKATEATHDLVIVNEYRPGIGHRRYPSFSVEFGAEVHILSAAKIDDDTYTVIIAPAGWAENIASQFQNIRDMEAQTISYKRNM